MWAHRPIADAASFRHVLIANVRDARVACEGTPPLAGWRGNGTRRHFAQGRIGWRTECIACLLIQLLHGVSTSLCERPQRLHPSACFLQGVWRRRIIGFRAGGRHRRRCSGRRNGRWFVVRDEAWATVPIPVLAAIVHLVWCIRFFPAGHLP